MHVGSNILVADGQIFLCWQAQRCVQHGAVFSGVDLVTAEHLLACFFDASGASELNQLGKTVEAHQVLGKVNVESARIESQLLSAAIFIGEKLTQRGGANIVHALSQLSPLFGCGDIYSHSCSQVSFDEMHFIPPQTSCVLALSPGDSIRSGVTTICWQLDSAVPMLRLCADHPSTIRHLRVPSPLQQRHLPWKI